jgi:hypothetical protein
LSGGEFIDPFNWTSWGIEGSDELLLSVMLEMEYVVCLVFMLHADCAEEVVKVGTDEHCCFLVDLCDWSNRQQWKRVEYCRRRCRDILFGRSLKSFPCRRGRLWGERIELFLDFSFENDQLFDGCVGLK